MVLTNAYCNKQGDGDASWKVYESPSNELLYELSPELSPEQAMSYVHFGRKFEKTAYREGFESGNNQAVALSKVEIDFLDKKIKFLEEQNLMLSTKLEQLLEEEI